VEFIDKYSRFGYSGFVRRTIGKERQNVIEQEKMLEILKKGLLFRNMDDDEIMEALETMGSHRMSIPSAP